MYTYTYIYTYIHRYTHMYIYIYAYTLYICACVTCLLGRVIASCQLVISSRQAARKDSTSYYYYLYYYYDDVYVYYHYYYYYYYVDCVLFAIICSIVIVCIMHNTNTYSIVSVISIIETAAVSISGGRRGVERPCHSICTL